MDSPPVSLGQDVGFIFIRFADAIYKFNENKKYEKLTAAEFLRTPTFVIIIDFRFKYGRVRL